MRAAERATLRTTTGACHLSENNQSLDRVFLLASLELGEGPLRALRYSLMMGIDDPITTREARQRTAMVIDPGNGPSTPSGLQARIPREARRTSTS